METFNLRSRMDVVHDDKTCCAEPKTTVVSCRPQTTSFSSETCATPLGMPPCSQITEARNKN